ncbi:helix-turn-helix transcriptional regulator [Demequina lutea]|uniref:Proteasome accessory factor B n=1 Tax=Demequina lutea TaxID=431489 RepID=A0A7Y9ZC05_9MICO|nr:WYL domain-containing protein [Demequina lutea]NYI41393.1 proteasome accessory factor B [Demequina lutea]
MATDPAERLLNLIIALTHARVRMTRAQIRSSVVGYEPTESALGSEEARRKDAAFERMFERDKDELRRMGVPLQTVVDPTHGDEIGYKIDASDAAMPAIDFSPAEAAALALAAEYWQGAMLGADAHQGLTKIASATQSVPRTPLTLGARTSAASDATAIVVDARARRMVVQFEYTSEGSGTVTRTVEPWQVLLRGSAEYLYGLDRDRAEPRTFRLSRIHGTMRAVGPDGAYEIPRPLPGFDWGASQALRNATVGLRPETGHALRQRGTVIGVDGDWDLVEVTYRYADALRDEVLGLGGMAKIIGPEDIAEDVRRYAASALAIAESTPRESTPRESPPGESDRG